MVCSSASKTSACVPKLQWWLCNWHGPSGMISYVVVLYLDCSLSNFEPSA
jgi:hypothetical protein